MHIRLNMIVKDEARVLARCLASVLPYIDSWLIVDTGSTDATVELARTVLKDKPGKVVQRPWLDHARSRTEAFRLACDAHNLGGRADYILWLDAKDVISSWPSVIPRGQLGFRALVRYGSLEYERNSLLAADKGWGWAQGVHEALGYKGRAANVPALHDLVTTVESAGQQASSADTTKYAKQAEILRAEFAATKSTRAAYYLAQALRDDGQLEAARTQYLMRAAMTHGWDEETWSALLEAAKLAERLRLGFDVVVSAYLQAYNARPTRGESLYHVARYCRNIGKPTVGLVFAKFAQSIPRPPDRLFIEFATYGWLVDEEVALCAVFSGNVALAQKTIAEIDVSKITNATDRARIEQNKSAILAMAVART